MGPFLLQEELLKERIVALHQDAAAARLGSGYGRARRGRSVRRAIGMRLVNAGRALIDGRPSRAGVRG